MGWFSSLFGSKSKKTPTGEKIKENVKDNNIQVFTMEQGLISEPEVGVPELLERPDEDTIDLYPKIDPLDLSKVNYQESPNRSNRKDEVRGIILHHTGPGSFNGIVNWLTNKDAKASAHYVLGKKAELTQLVNTSRKAWHAGTSKAVLDGEMRSDLNNCTIGIEICNIGILEKDDDGNFYYEQGRTIKRYTGKTQPVKASITYPSGQILEGYVVPYPEKQIDKLIALCKGIIEKYPQIGPEDILTHYGIATPEGRKSDPFGLDMKSIIKRIFT